MLTIWVKAGGGLLSEVGNIFSGVGSLGIEALSRGADHLTAVENNSSVFKILLKNIKHICDDASDIKLYRKSAKHFLNLNTEKFDIIFVDPPYGEYDFTTIKESVSKFLNLNGILCMEMKGSCGAVFSLFLEHPHAHGKPCDIFYVFR